MTEEHIRRAAREAEPVERALALKMVLDGERATPEDRKRFARETHAVAALNRQLNVDEARHRIAVFANRDG